MKRKIKYGMYLAGAAAGAVNGLFGAGGGMVLVPLLTLLSDLDENDIFPASVSIILPVCLISLSFSYKSDAAPAPILLVYITTSAVGGILAGILGKKLPTKWLHKFLGVIILWGGIRYIC
jgi:uncharacterized membrane protein YfcA